MGVWGSSVSKGPSHPILACIIIRPLNVTQPAHHTPPVRRTPFPIRRTLPPSVHAAVLGMLFHLFTVFGDDLFLSLAEDVVFLAYSGEGLDGSVDVRGVVGGGELDTDSGLALGDHRVIEADYIDAFGK